MAAPSISQGRLAPSSGALPSPTRWIWPAWLFISRLLDGRATLQAPTWAASRGVPARSDPEGKRGAVPRRPPSSQPGDARLQHAAPVSRAFWGPGRGSLAGYIFLGAGPAREHLGGFGSSRSLPPSTPSRNSGPRVLPAAPGTGGVSGAPRGPAVSAGGRGFSADSTAPPGCGGGAGPGVRG